MKFQMSLVLTLASTLAFAQQGGIGAVKVEPSPARAGQEVKITVSAEGEAPTFCGMVVHFDDGGESRNIKIASGESTFPVSISKTYAKPGTYSIKAEGKKITTHFPCVGTATAKLVVEGAPAAAATKPATAAAVCPDGYKMTGKMGKMGDFACKGGKAAAMPAQALACGAGLESFANEKARQVGCRKPVGKKK
ncbi:MAG: hypothetical protein A2040_16490 [Rhodocyclales bacterium GWA2_65_19]|nr:MAG: hypothetical protein A2040_16490 [Rhodocyclales bacterium GWA2_65_19]